jgi:hypothetical protein
MTKWAASGYSLKTLYRSSWICPPVIKVVWLLESIWYNFRYGEMGSSWMCTFLKMETV